MNNNPQPPKIHIASGSRKKTIEGAHARKHIFLIHIPKTAGTTINALFHRSFSDETIETHLELRPDKLDSILRQPEGISFASGHIRLPNLLSRIDRRKWFVLVFFRNPVHQFLSHLKHVKALAADGHEDRLRAHTPLIQEIAGRLRTTPLNDVDQLHRIIFEEFHESRQLFDNCQVRYMNHRIEGVIVGEHAKLACRALTQVDHVGVSEQIKASLATLSRALDLDLGQGGVPTENPALSNEKIDLNDPVIREYFLEAVRWDALIYTEAQKILQADCATHDVDIS